MLQGSINSGPSRGDGPAKLRYEQRLLERAPDLCVSVVLSAQMETVKVEACLPCPSKTQI